MNKSFFNKYPVIGMCHLLPLPEDIGFNREMGIEKIQNRALREIKALQRGGVDAIIFSNEFSLPYNSNMGTVNIAAMTAIICNLKEELKLPFGIDCMYDIKSALSIANAVKADFVRGICAGPCNFLSMSSYVNTREILEFYNNISSKYKPDIWCSIYTEYIELMERKCNINLESLIEKIKLEINPQAICIHSKNLLNKKEFFKNLLEDNFINVLADGGCNTTNISEIKPISSGVIVGTYLKESHIFHNEIDEKEVKNFIQQFDNH